jgi:hypothetical protein
MRGEKGVRKKKREGEEEEGDGDGREGRKSAVA